MDGVIVDEVGEPFDERKDVLRVGGSDSGSVLGRAWKSDAMVFHRTRVEKELPSARARARRCRRARRESVRRARVWPRGRPYTRPAIDCANCSRVRVPKRSQGLTATSQLAAGPVVISSSRSASEASASGSTACCSSSGAGAGGPACLVFLLEGAISPSLPRAALELVRRASGRIEQGDDNFNSRLFRTRRDGNSILSQLDPPDCQNHYTDNVIWERPTDPLDENTNRVWDAGGRARGASERRLKGRGFDTDEYIDDGLRCCCLRDRRLELRRRLVKQRRFRINVAHERVRAVGRAELPAVDERTTRH